uniref:Uncharacterized protein n=1 Tax=Arundo donax TaxID=35708 RepID=A0A0A9ACH5_ARUDO
MLMLMFIESLLLSKMF